MYEKYIFIFVLLLVSLVAKGDLALLGDAARPAYGCNDILHNRGNGVQNTTRGIYYVNYYGGVVLPVLCDFSIYAGKAATLVYKINSGLPDFDIAGLWTSQAGVNDLNETALTVNSTTLNYASRLLVLWPNVNLLTIRLFTKGVMDKFVNFKVQGQPYSSWFSRSSYDSSSWTDILPVYSTSTFGQIFTLTGDTNRLWMINEQLAGCGGDTGHMQVEKAADPCRSSYAPGGVGVQILYAKGATNSLATSYGRSDTFMIFADLPDIVGPGDLAAYPASGCNAVLDFRKGVIQKTGSSYYFPTNRTYYIQYDAATVLPVLCDFNIFPGKAATLDFKLSAGLSGEPSSLWNSGAATNDLNAQYTNLLPSAVNYISRIGAAKWSTIKTTSVRIYTNGNLNQYLNFNAQGQTTTSWFHSSHLLETSWDKAHMLDGYTYPNTASTGEYWSIAGDAYGRRFYINKRWITCPGDIGYMTLLFSTEGCGSSWFPSGQAGGLVIMYSPIVNETTYPLMKLANVFTVWTDVDNFGPFYCYNGGTLVGATCVCPSGFYGPQCAVSAPATCTPTQIDNLGTRVHPVIDTNATVYENNGLTFLLRGEYVSGRVYRNLTIVDSTNAKCSFLTANSYWSHYFDPNSCQDVFTLRLPWANATSCGFVKTTESDVITFKGKVFMRYEETIQLPSLNVVRSTENSYDIYVHFPRTLTVSLSSLAVSASVNMDAALTAERYDPVNEELTLEISTGVGYPYMLVNTSVTVVTVPSTMYVTSTGVHVDGAACTQTPGSACLQRLSFRVKLLDDTTCDFGGTYVIAASLTQCREITGDCISTNISVTFTTTSSSVCASVALKPLATGRMTAYGSSNFATSPVHNFRLGEQVFFAIDVDAGIGNTGSITFVDIFYDDNSGNGQKYLMSNQTVTAKGVSASLTTSPPVNNYFSLYLTGQVFPSTSSGSYTFTAICDYSFAGANKRMMTSFDVAPSEHHQLVNARTRIRIAHPHEPNHVHVAVAEPVYNNPVKTLETEGYAGVGVGILLGIIPVACVYLVAVVAMRYYYKRKEEQLSAARPLL